MSGKHWILTTILFFAVIVGSTFVFGFSDAKGYKPSGVALIFSIVFPSILFPGIFLDGLMEEWRIAMNPWVQDVEEMHYWFNPMFFAWLYSSSKRRYMKWIIGLSLPFVFLLGTIFVALFTLHWVTFETFMIGFLVGAAFTTVLGFTFYRCSWK